MIKAVVRDSSERRLVAVYEKNRNEICINDIYFVAGVY
jgi:hypothetical protein